MTVALLTPSVDIASAVLMVGLSSSGIMVSLSVGFLLVGASVGVRGARVVYGFPIQ